MPNIACTVNNTRNSTIRLGVLIVKLSEPIKRRNAPTEATILIAWSAKNSLHENTRRGGMAAGFSRGKTCEGTVDVTILTSLGTSGKEDIATIDAAGACASIVTGTTAGKLNI